MSVDPTKGVGGTSSHQPSGDPKPAAAFAGAASYHVSLDDLLRSQVSLSTKKRDELFAQLTPPTQKIAKVIIQCVENLEFLFWQMKNPKLDKGQLLKDWESVIEQMNAYEEEGIATYFIDGTQEEDPSLFMFRKEITLNRMMNHLVYKENVNIEIRLNKRPIISTFFGDQDSIDLDNVTFTIKIPESETHNQGKSVVFVDFTYSQKPLGRIVYNPRDGLIDRAIIGLFHSINELPSSKELPYFLPEYRIESLGSHASLWEYIPGESLKKHRSAAAFIDEKAPASRKRQIHEKLNRMDCILEKIHVSDLHGENLICRKFGKGPESDFEIVPIDLENIQVVPKVGGTPVKTQLEGDPSQVQLTPTEEVLIKDFNARIHDISYRLLVLSTQPLLKLISDYKNAGRCAEQIMKQLKKDGFEVEVSIQTLTEKILLDSLNYDVPYFTKRGDIVYYGQAEEGFIIAREVKHG